MTTRYIEFDSTYRDRNLYPNPAQFQVSIAESGVKTQAQAVSPISNASPIKSWNNSMQESAESNTVTGVTISPITTPTLAGIDVFKITTTDTLRQINDFYVGSTLLVTITAVNYARRIIGYKYINTTTGIVTVDSVISDVEVNTASATIIQPTPLATNTANAVIYFYIPTGTFIDNYYKGYYIQSLGPSCTVEYREITAYDGITRLATLASATTDDWAASANADNNFVIRKEIPTNSGTILGISSSGKIIQLATTASANASLYISAYLRMTEPIPTAGGGYSTEVAPYNEERRIVRYVTGNGTFLAISGSTFTLNPQASDVDDFYTNSFITDTTTGVTRQVISYTGSTRSGTVASAWGAGAVGDQWYVRTVYLDTPFSTNPVVGGADTYEVEQYTMDGCSPFNYTGSLVSVSEEVCCEVELLNVIIPNLTLASGRGGRAAFYPYFYVLFEPIGASGGQQKNIIYSNNPNSSGKLFRVPADDTPTPLISTFIKLDSDGMTHTIKFKPTQAAFKFGVYHANGEPFQTEQQDTSPPTEPDPLVQVSACFTFKRI